MPFWRVITCRIDRRAKLAVEVTRFLPGKRAESLVEPKILSEELLTSMDALSPPQCWVYLMLNSFFCGHLLQGEAVLRWGE